MRLNKYLALSIGLSRRAADRAITQGRVTINDQPAAIGQEVNEKDIVKFDSEPVKPNKPLTLMLNKPVGYVCSREGQGNPTVYDLLPPQFHHLKTVGRLDKDSSGLLLLTNDGDLANQLTHPRYQKEKIYEVKLNQTLAADDKAKLLRGVMLEDGLSKFIDIKEYSADSVEVKLAEGRKRQIRRTLQALGYEVIKLHRSLFGDYELGSLDLGRWRKVS